MAKIPRSPPRSRKRLQHTNIAATPLRRSRRIAFREPFRFNDLPPELRNSIYCLVTESDDVRYLTDKLPATAKALSQVCRSIRAESLSTHFSVNRFTVKHLYWATTREAQQEVARIDKWFALFGELAARHTRALTILHMCIFTMSNSTLFSISANIHRVGKLPHWNDFFDEYRAAFLARVRRHSNHSDWGCDELDNIEKCEKVFPVGVMRSRGELRLTPQTLQLLLRGLHLVIPVPNDTQSDSSLISAALLSQLE
jgi:hypothetical protein